MSTITLGNSYFPRAFEPEEIRKRAQKHLKGKVDFDTIVGSGYSGALALGVIARSLKVNMVIVRKDADRNHSHCGGVLVEGTLGKKWLFVDDFVSSGATFVRVHETLTEALRKRARCSVSGEMWKTECIGAFSYERDYAGYMDLVQLRRNYARIDKYCRDIS